MRRELRDRTIKDPRAKRCSWRSTADGRSFELPYNAERRQSFEQIIGRVDLPPSKALSDATLTSVVIVVPTLTHSENREEPVVARIVACHVLSASINMRKRINRKGRVVNEHRAPEESDDEAVPPGEEEARKGQRDGRQLLQPVQPD